MTADEEIDLQALELFVEWLITDGGVHGLVPLGSTGEFYALSPDEREDVLQRTIAAAAGRVPVVAGISSGATRDVISFAEQAETLGASGVLLAAPYYSLPTPDELLEHIRSVDAAIDIPIILYNCVSRTGVDMTPDLVDRLAELDNVRYIKESTGDISRVSEIRRRCGDAITVFCGGDTVALESFLLGAAGWVTGAANCLPKECVRLYELAVWKQDYLQARGLYFRILPLLSLLENGSKYTQFVKAACEMVGHPVGPPRSPLQSATKNDIDAIRAALAVGPKH